MEAVKASHHHLGEARVGLVYSSCLKTTSLGVKVQKQTQDQEQAEIHLEGKDARSDNEAARRTENARQDTDVASIDRHRGRLHASDQNPREGENEEVEMVAVETQQPGAKRKIPLTKTKEQNDSEKEVKRLRPSTKKNKTDVLEDMINKLSEKMEKTFEMLVMRLSDSEAESKVLALKHDKRLEELEKKIS
ncbi:hypothetical protein MRX96_027933 [Rhipicephalus microplus]